MATRVSLLVPCYNAAQHLPRLFETVRAQTSPFAEIICYNDASSDATSAVARGLGAKVIEGDVNRGTAYARNRLWQMAASDWVHFHDADDLLERTFVEKMIARASEDLDTIICAAEWRREDTRQVELQWTYSNADLRAAPVSYLLTHPVGGINGLYRKATLERIGGFNEHLQVWEDADLHVRLAIAGARIAVVEEALVVALRRSDSVSAPLLRNWRNRLVALESYAPTLPPTDIPALAAELERAAHALLREADPPAARRALNLALSLGAEVPTSGNALVRVCRRIFGPMTALRLQAFARRS